MAVLGLSANDVVKAVSEQNVQVAAGQIGQPTVPKGQEFQFTMTTLGRLSDAEQFGDIIIKADVFFSSRRRHTISVSAFLLNRSSDLGSHFCYSSFFGTCFTDT